MNEENSEFLSEVPETSEEVSEVPSEESSEECSEVVGTGEYSSILLDMQTDIQDNTEAIKLVEDQLVLTNDRLDHTVTFLFIFACAAFMLFIWRIFYGWFYKPV